MILLVDDRPENILPLKRILELQNLATESAGSGEEALKKILKNDYSLIIMDVQMPGMDGFEVAETIRGSNKSKDIPILFLSAVNKDKKFVTQGYNSGGVDYLTKPVDPEILILKVQTFLRLSSQQRELKKIHEQLKQEIQVRKSAQEELSVINDSLEIKVRDRTKELVEKNHQLEAMNLELQQFTWVVSHDLKEPLRKIQTFCNLLKERFITDNAMAQSYLQRSITSAERMKVLIDDLLHYSRLSFDVVFTFTDLSALVRDLIEDMKETIQETNATVKIENLPGVEVIPGQMRQVFQNLLSNSLKFVRPDVAPEITIRGEIVATLDPDSVKDPDGKFCKITISDNGSGFDPRFLDRIFVIFQRLNTEDKVEGTGIGLAIVKKIIENHKGIVTATSRENEGATFVCIFPIKH